MAKLKRLPSGNWVCQTERWQKIWDAWHDLKRRGEPTWKLAVRVAEKTNINLTTVRRVLKHQGVVFDCKMRGKDDYRGKNRQSKQTAC